MLPAVLNGFLWIKWGSIISGSYENSRLTLVGAQCVWTQSGEWYSISITSMSSSHPWIELISIPTVMSVALRFSNIQVSGNITNQPCQYTICCSHTLMEAHRKQARLEKVMFCNERENDLHCCEEDNGCVHVHTVCKHDCSHCMAILQVAVCRRLFFFYNWTDLRGHLISYSIWIWNSYFIGSGERVHCKCFQMC